MGVGTTSQKQTASGLSLEGQTSQADPREMGRKESACLLPDSRLFLWETRRPPSSRIPGPVDASSSGFGLQGGLLWSLPASPDWLSLVRCFSVWLSGGSRPLPAGLCVPCFAFLHIAGAQQKPVCLGKVVGYQGRGRKGAEMSHSEDEALGVGLSWRRRGPTEIRSDVHKT